MTKFRKGAPVSWTWGAHRRGESRKALSATSRAPSRASASSAQPRREGPAYLIVAGQALRVLKSHSELERLG